MTQTTATSILNNAPRWSHPPGNQVVPSPWQATTVADVELATLGWVHWHNTSRLHGYLGDLPPAEFEATFYATNRTDQPLVEIQ